MYSKIVVALVILLMSASVHARYVKDRAGSWEGTLMANHQGEDTIASKNGEKSEF